MTRLGIRNLIFDVDGTLLDSRRDIAAAQLYVIRKLGVTHLTAEDIYPHIGKPLSEIFTVLLPPALHDQIPRAKETYVTYYRAHALDTTDVFPGVRDTLTHFSQHGLRLAIATTKSSMTTVRVLTHFGIAHHFVQIQGSDEMPFKPDPFILNKILADQRWDPRETVMVGDTAVDMLAGRNAGMRTCGVTYGALSREELEQLRPDHLVDTFTELQGVVFNAAGSGILS